MAEDVNKRPSLMQNVVVYELASLTILVDEQMDILYVNVRDVHTCAMMALQ